MRKRHAAVYIDSERVRVVVLEPNGVSRVELITNCCPPYAGEHRTEPGHEGAFHAARMVDIARHLGKIEELLVLGHGPSCEAFQNELRRSHPELSSRVAQTRHTASGLGDIEILDAATRFFAAHERLSGSIPAL